MTNAAATKARREAGDICQECGSTDFIQTHHEIPGDDNSIVVVCGQCHSIKHPDVPKALFLSVRRQLYWFNKPAASLARQWGVHPRTIIRAAKRLAILPGDELSPWDEELIRNNIPKLNRGKAKPRQKYQPISIATDIVTVLQAAKEIGVHFTTVYRWIDTGVISGVKFGGILFIPKSEIERLKKVSEKEQAAD